MLCLCLFVKRIVCKDHDYSVFRDEKFMNDNFEKCTRMLTEVDNLQGVPPTGGEGETMVTP